MKQCRRCGKVRPAERFAPQRATCRDCINAAARARGPKPYRSEAHRRSTYGLMPEEYDAMVHEQRDLCPVCGRPPAVLVVDHDHATGALRGLLCGPCNRALGHLQDEPDLCRAAARYLRSFIDW